MKKSSFVWSCFVMAFFVACSQAEVENPEAEELRMFISASINGPKEAKSRYAITDLQHLSFKEEDNIGLFVDNEEAVQWTYDGSDWFTAGNMIVYWPDKTKEHTFRAFYPYADASSYESVPMPDLSSQDGTIENLEEYDFLVATSVQKYSDGGIVDFQSKNTSFEHVSTLLKFNFLEGGDLSGMVINNVTLKGGNIVAPSSYSFSNGGVVTLTPDNSSDVLTVTPTGQKTFYLIVHENQTPNPAVELTVEYDVNGETYVAKSENFVKVGFVGGMCQDYTITIQNSSLVIEEAAILPWGTGETLDNIIINGEEKTVS
jgi:hypothetical protein